MAQLAAFCYRTGSSPAHQLDVRVKFILMILMSLAILRAVPGYLGLITIGQVILIVHLHLSVKSIAKELRYLLIFLGLVFVVRAISMPGDPLIALNWLPVTREGIRDGGLIVWRMLMIVLLSLPLVATTRPSEIKNAVEWFLKPVPFIPRARIGTMMGLLLRFIPLIFSQAAETMDSQKARAVEQRKNPIYRIKMFLIPFIRRTFTMADMLVIAMEARCYTENRSAPRFSSRLRDWIVLISGIGLCFMIFLHKSNQ